MEVKYSLHLISNNGHSVLKSCCRNFTADLSMRTEIQQAQKRIQQKIFQIYYGTFVTENNH